MKAAQKLGKSSYAGTQLIPHMYPPTTSQNWYFNILTKLRLSQMSSQFLDFQKSAFPEVAIKLYSDFKVALKRNDKTALNNLITMAHYEMIRASQKHNVPLPYTILPSLTTAKIVYASIVTENNSDTEEAKFAQLTVLFSSEALEQLTVFERRLDVKTKDAWKLASVEDLLKIK
mmetsp:Transcript_4944/g.9270  ORF Transcript_4944/g.9270 Transcript_4944/m.9270 type:complete len:174 (-) Transcript_4944:18-539(-)